MRSDSHLRLSLYLQYAQCCVILGIGLVGGSVDVIAFSYENLTVAGGYVRLDYVHRSARSLETHQPTLRMMLERIPISLLDDTMKLLRVLPKELSRIDDHFGLSKVT